MGLHHPVQARQVPDHPDLFVYTRTLGDESLLVLCNFSETEQRFEIPAEYRIPSQPYYSRYMWTPTPAPLLPEEPAVPEGETNG